MGGLRVDTGWRANIYPVKLRIPCVAQRIRGAPLCATPRELWRPQRRQTLARLLDHVLDFGIWLDEFSVPIEE